MDAETQAWHEQSYQQVVELEAAAIAWAYTNRTQTARGLQMDINATYPSKWLRAADIGGRTVKVEIHSVDMEQFQDGTSKPAVYFKNKDKALILNKTNATTIAASYGNDTDAWAGKPLELFSMKVQGPSGLVDGLRVRVPDEPKPAQPQPDDLGDLDDDIPF